MIYRTQRSLSRHLFVAGLALAGTLAGISATVAPAHAATAGYSASLATAVEAPAKKVVNGVLWRCTADSCAGPVDGARPVNTCRQVAKAFGPVTKFATPKGDLSAEQLQSCNVAA